MEYQLFRVFFSNGADIFIRATSFDKAAVKAMDWVTAKVEAGDTPKPNGMWSMFAQEAGGGERGDNISITQISWVRNAVVN
jgi:hypothetical protein